MANVVLQSTIAHKPLSVWWSNDAGIERKLERIMFVFTLLESPRLVDTKLFERTTREMAKRFFHLNPESEITYFAPDAVATYSLA